MTSLSKGQRKGSLLSSSLGGLFPLALPSLSPILPRVSLVLSYYLSSRVTGEVPFRRHLQ